MLFGQDVFFREAVDFSCRQKLPIMLWSLGPQEFCFRGLAGVLPLLAADRIIIDRIADRVADGTASDGAECYVAMSLDSFAASCGVMRGIGAVSSRRRLLFGLIRVHDPSELS